MMISAMRRPAMISEDIIYIQHPSPMESPTISYVVLALDVIRHRKDSSMFTVLFEGTVALLGLGAVLTMHLSPEDVPLSH